MITPKKSLGQHFLTNDSFAAQLAEVSVTENIPVIEIGPGLGQLTKHLLARGAKVTAYEIDGRSIEILQKTFANEITSGQLTVLDQDITTVDPASISFPYTVVGNIPYYITGAIFRMFLDAAQAPSLTFLVQKEVAQRIVAREGRESILSIAVKLRGAPRLVTIVPRSAFKPNPKVNSAIIHIETTPWTENISYKDVMEVVKLGFAHPRKLLVSNLDKMTTAETKQQLITTFEKRRAETIQPGEWVVIAKLLKNTL